MPEITNDELARRLADMRNELRDDMAEIRRNQERYVLREVHTAERDGDMDRLKRLEDSMKAQAEQRRGDLRWRISALVVPAVLVAVNLWTALKGT